VSELHRQLAIMRQRIALLSVGPEITPDQQIRRLEAAFSAFGKSWEQLYKVQSEQLADALAELSQAGQLLHLTYEHLQEQEKALMIARQQAQTQQRHYQEVFELIPDAYLVTDAHGIIQEANLLAARLFHKPQQFLLGKPLALFICEQERQTFYQQVKELIQTKQSSETRQDWNVCLLRRKHEKFNAVLTVVTGCEPVSGQAAILHWFVRGAVEPQSLEKPEQILKAVVQHVQESIVITTPNLDAPGPQVIFVNSAFTQMTGYTLEEMLGKTPRILQGADTERAILTQLRQTLEQGQCFQGEVTNYHKDGTPYRAHLHCIPVQNQRGEVTHFVSVQSPLKSA
jgi:PAS domain S-box-containing protein